MIPKEVECKDKGTNGVNEENIHTGVFGSVVDLHEMAKNRTGYQ